MPCHCFLARSLPNEFHLVPIEQPWEIGSFCGSDQFNCAFRYLNKWYKILISELNGNTMVHGQMIKNYLRYNEIIFVCLTTINICESDIP